MSLYIYPLLIVLFAIVMWVLFGKTKTTVEEERVRKMKALKHQLKLDEEIRKRREKGL